MLYERSRKPLDKDASGRYVTVSLQDILEEQALMEFHESSDKVVFGASKPASDPSPTPAAAAAAPDKFLFLDGVRGLAAILVVSRHTNEYMQDVDLGSCAVDTFFVLSSFLLTMLFMKRSIKLLEQGASYRTWVFTLANYFSKRFFRVYPLFATLSVVMWLLPFKDKKQYFNMNQEGYYDLYKTLTFDVRHRYFMMWTLPLEIAYYLVIPGFVVVVLGMRRYWWLVVTSMYLWTIHEGWYKTRQTHSGLEPHTPTFSTGSLAAVVFVKLDNWMKVTAFEFKMRHKLLIWTVEYAALGLLLSLCLQGLLFNWVHANVAPATPGFKYISLLVSLIFVVEMLLPSPLRAALEWSVLRYWGKVSFSVYLLHSFVVLNPTVSSQQSYYDRVISRFGLVLMLATASYHCVERPSQVLAQRVSRFLDQQEKRHGCGGAKYSQPCIEVHGGARVA